MSSPVRPEAPGPLALLAKLSKRRQEVVRLLLEGYKVPTIARELSISDSTVRNHLSSVFKALGVAGQEELIGLFRRPPRAQSPSGVRNVEERAEAFTDPDQILVIQFTTAQGEGAVFGALDAVITHTAAWGWAPDLTCRYLRDLLWRLETPAYTVEVPTVTEPQ